MAQALKYNCVSLCFIVCKRKITTQTLLSDAYKDMSQKRINM